MINRHAAGPVAVATLAIAVAIAVAGCVGSRAGATDGLAATDGSANPSTAAVSAAGERASRFGHADGSCERRRLAADHDADCLGPDLGRPAGDVSDVSGAEPADGGAGPASTVVAAPAKVAKVVDWYRQALVAAGYSIEALAGPMEDGSTVIDAVGLEPACRVQASIGPRGSQTTVSILFAADCPFR